MHIAATLALAFILARTGIGLRYRAAALALAVVEAHAAGLVLFCLFGRSVSTGPVVVLLVGRLGCTFVGATHEGKSSGSRGGPTTESLDTRWIELLH